MPTLRIGLVIGSLRAGSFNRQLADAVRTLAGDRFVFEEIGIADLPLYDQDDDAAFPAAGLRFKRQVEACDALLFVTPEYNRSVPGVLKNAIDCGSRPYGQSVWGGKPGAVVSVSGGGIGGFGANHHLRQSMVFLDVPMMAQPEAYVGGATTLFDEKGDVAKDETREFLQRFMTAYADWVGRHVGRA